MRCPFCGHEDTQVKDSRPTDDNSAIRRRRYCPSCGSRFTTFERVQLRELTVVKKNGQRVQFDRDKLAKNYSYQGVVVNIESTVASIQRALDAGHDAAALLADLRRTVDAPAVWARQPGGREAVVAWFQAVHDRLVSVGFHAPIMGELGDTVRALAAA